MDQKIYNNGLFNYSRYVTREVPVGDVPLGGSNPIRIQSMTTTDTMNTIATVEQAIRMVEAGCEYVRITAPSIKDAQNLENIKNELRRRGYQVPLVADIHFTPNAAEVAARIVEKVRVNPGNYADRKRFEMIEYSDSEYNNEIDRIRDRFLPLVRICKEYGTAMRIGVNHGSLSDRIMSRYGDTPLGMVESALEFLRICEDEGYFSIVLSMKSSNPQVMVQAYRLLVSKMMAAGMNYPLHLGVTEAGDGLDGRIKSAAGIGTLLEDGLGDTIRVSLTEPPENEAPVAIRLAQRYMRRTSHKPVDTAVKDCPVDPYIYSKRITTAVLNMGGTNIPRVFADLSAVSVSDSLTPGLLKSAGYSYDPDTDKWNVSDMAADYIYLGKLRAPDCMPGGLNVVYDAETWSQLADRKNAFPYFRLADYGTSEKSEIMNLVEINIDDIDKLSTIAGDKTVAAVLVSCNAHSSGEIRRMLYEMSGLGITCPVVLKNTYRPDTEREDIILHSSTDFSVHLFDGFGDAVWIAAPEIYRNMQSDEINALLFGILQSARLRISKTEYISCPSCGRTLFDLQEVTANIRNRTSHLKGVKIAIMGCIVNGPGEMADADYGYVGSGIDKITLYRGKEVVKKNIHFSVAVDELINIIKEDGNWVENN